MSNRLHGTAKKIWRESNLDYKDDVKSSVFLLNCLDNDIQNQSKMWFDRNMIQLKESEVEELIGSEGKKFSKLHKSWLRKYCVWIGLEDQGIMNIIDE